MPVSQINSNSLASGVPARSNMPAGSVLQVVRNGAVLPTTTFSSSSYVDSGASVTITPSSSNSRIMLLFRSPRQSYSGGAPSANYRFYRNTTGIGNDPQTQNNLDDSRYGYSMSMFFIDTPNTTSSITYRIYARVASGTNFSFSGDDAYEFIAMEIAG